MRVSQTAVRAALVLAAAGIGFAAWSATEDTAAHAADRRPALEQAGGLLDHALPTQASDRAKQVVEQVVPHAAKPKPAKAHHPRKAHGRDQLPPPAQAPAEPPVVDPIVDEPPPVVDVSPTTDPEPAPGDSDVVTLPAIDPAPLPDADGTAYLPGIPAPPVVLPAPPVALETPPLLSPVLAGQPAPVAVPVPATTAVIALDVAPCDHDHDANVDVDLITQLIASLTNPGGTQQATPAPGCPGTPGTPLPDHIDCVPGSITNSAASSAQMTADLAVDAVPPALARLEHTRPRSTIPTSRTTHPEPGPA